MTSSRYHVRCESKESAKKVKSTKVQTYYYMYWIGINWVSCNEGDIFRTKMCSAVQFLTYSPLLLCLYPSAGSWT